MSLIILVDTREKDSSIQNELSARGIPFIKTKLNYGDYSFIYSGNSYENQVVIERKGSLDEIIGNFTTGRKRFENEFKRARGCKVYLMVEADAIDIQNKKYRSRMSPNDLRRFFNTWCYKFALNLHFVNKDMSTDFIVKTFLKYLEGSK